MDDVLEEIFAINNAVSELKDESNRLLARMDNLHNLLYEEWEDYDSSSTMFYSGHNDLFDFSKFGQSRTRTETETIVKNGNILISQGNGELFNISNKVAFESRKTYPLQQNDEGKVIDKVIEKEIQRAWVYVSKANMEKLNFNKSSNYKIVILEKNEKITIEGKISLLGNKSAIIIIDISNTSIVQIK